MKEDKYGVSMKRFCRAHEAYVAEQLAQGGDPERLLALHLEKLGFLQHERLVHLIVLVMTVLGELFVVDLVILHPETSPWSALAMAGIAILLGFYFAHYFFLENTTQHWYRLADRIRASGNG